MESTLIFLISSLNDCWNPYFLKKFSPESSHAAHFLKYLWLSHSIAFYGARSWPLGMICPHEPTRVMLPLWSLCFSELFLVTVVFAHTVVHVLLSHHIYKCFKGQEIYC